MGHFALSRQINKIGEDAYAAQRKYEQERQARERRRAEERREQENKKNGK